MSDKAEPPQVRESAIDPNALPLFPPPRDRARPFDPPPALLQWQHEAPARQVRTWDGRVAWVIGRYADVQNVMRDETKVSVDPARPGFAQKSAAYSAVMGRDHNLRTLDNPEHGVQKRMLIRDFTVRRIAEMEPAISAKIHQLIDDFIAAGEPGDIFQDLTFLVPTWVICNLLGVPFDDRRFFAERATTCISHSSSFEEAAAAGQELYDYLDAIVTQKEAAQSDDLLARLIGEMRAGNLARVDLIGIARFLLIAGHDSTANTLALSILALLQHPEQLADLRRNLGDAGYVTNAVDELLRYLSVAHTGRYRVSIAEIDVGGQKIAAEQPLIFANNAADRDEAVFPGADRLDLRRENARATLVFGSGAHQCLGQFLARREIFLFHQALWARLPDLCLAVPFGDIEFRENGTIYAVESLPVRWT